MADSFADDPNFVRFDPNDPRFADIIKQLGSKLTLTPSGSATDAQIEKGNRERLQLIPRQETLRNRYENILSNIRSNNEGFDEGVRLGKASGAFGNIESASRNAVILGAIILGAVVLVSVAPTVNAVSRRALA